MCNVMDIVQVTPWATEKGGSWVSYLFQVSFLSSYVNVETAKRSFDNSLWGITFSTLQVCALPSQAD